jgi:hypothetical protein
MPYGGGGSGLSGIGAVAGSGEGAGETAEEGGLGPHQIGQPHPRLQGAGGVSLHCGTLPMHPHPPLVPVIMGSTELCKCSLSARSRRRIPCQAPRTFSPFLHPGLSCEYQEVQPRAFRSLFINLVLAGVLAIDCCSEHPCQCSSGLMSAEKRGASYSFPHAYSFSMQDPPLIQVGTVQVEGELVSRKRLEELAPEQFSSILILADESATFSTADADQVSIPYHAWHHQVNHSRRSHC